MGGRGWGEDGRISCSCDYMKGRHELGSAAEKIAHSEPGTKRGPKYTKTNTLLSPPELSFGQVKITNTDASTGIG